MYAIVCDLFVVIMVPAFRGAPITTFKLLLPFDELMDNCPFVVPLFQVTTTDERGVPLGVQLVPAIVPPLTQTCIVEAESQFPVITYWYCAPDITQIAPVIVTCALRL